ncbi:MAG TPA: response regulator transcription factor [Burkholderiales bacterium]|nr:response regulator transcription factor [Burkholderiales bacterium]
MRILLVEDDALLVDAIARSLSQSAHTVDVARSGEEADAALSTTEYDLVVLDIELPGLDGLEVLKRLRARRSLTPVLIVTVRDGLEERIAGLDLGADDYLAKPFHLSELEARVRALIRRAHAGATSDLVYGRLRLDMAARRLYCDDRPIDLTSRELAVLELLLLRGSRVVTKQQIIEHLYGWEDASTSNTVEVFIYRLRRKIEPCGVDIRTVRGMGYLIEKPNAA